MANTCRKRPAPSHAPSSSNVRNNGTAHHAAASSSSSSRQSLPVKGIDTLLAKYARHLPPGGSISIRLIKGPTSQSVDPIAARQAAKKRAAASSGNSSGNDSDNGASGGGGGPKATNSRSITMPLTFPRMAKFSETVAPPDFGKSLGDGRIYEEEVPKAKDESDEEESTAYKPSNGEGTDPNNPTASNDAPKKKKRRWRRNDPRPRRWVLQEKAEFFDRIRKRRQRGSTGGDDADDEAQGISNQYHGVLESNHSKYVLLSVAPPTVKNEGATSSAPSSTKMATEQICIQPIHGFHTFSQPYKFASLTMEEAENAIEQQRNVVTRYMMHGKLSASQNNSSEAKAALASGVATGGRGSRSLGPTPKAMSRARLLGKLAGGGGGGGGGDADGDDEDVMGDVRFSSSKVGGGGGSKARKELLSSLGGDGVTVDDDGVLGGANNSEFGGRRRFGRVAVNKEAADGDNSKDKGGKGGATSTGFEAGAMEEGFYQRDVAAEYEALDYDANEQFDDDDVNVGEDEMMDDGGGFGGGDYESGDDNMLDSDDEEGSDDDAFGGMATASGLKAMLARARGDSPAMVNGADSNAASGTGMDALDASAMNIPENGSGTDGAAGSSGGKAIGKLNDGAKKTTEEVEKEKKSSSPGAKSTSASMAAMGIEKDKDGKRLITLEAVRREIWLNNGAITSKRLTKKFDVGKKHPDRQALFKSIVMELCTIKKDADGNKLVLKQHYAKN